LVKQVFSREYLTHKKGMLFAPLVHTELNSEPAPAPVGSDASEPHSELTPAEPTPDKTADETGPTALLAEDIRAQAFAEGLAQGLEEGRQLAQQAQVLNEQEALAAQSNAHTLAVLAQIDQQVASLVEDPAQLQVPLKRLALHLAEQLVLGELTLSPQSVERLIDRCLDTLDVPDACALVVELNPNDLALLQNQQRPEGQAAPAWRLQADNLLLPGSVRVRADDAVVSDLIENRLESLAQSLLNDNPQWQPQSAFAPSRLASRLASQRGSAQQIEDAPSRPAAMQAEATPQAQDIEEAEDPTQHTYEAHELMRAAPSAVTAASAQAINQQFANTLSEIQLDLDKLDG